MNISFVYKRIFISLMAILLFVLFTIGTFASMKPDAVFNSPTPVVIASIINDLNKAGAGSKPGPKVVCDGIVYFPAFDGLHGVELWRSDGTLEGTWLVKDIFIGTSDSLSTEPMVAVNDRFFFAADDGVHGNELWVSDGTFEGTSLVKDITPGTLYNSTIDNMLAVGDVLFFVTNYKLWVSDGTSQGTIPLPYSDPFELTTIDDALYFFIYNYEQHVYELWKTNGVSENVILLGQFNSKPEELENVNGTLFFKARHLNTQEALWKSRGTLSSTTFITNMRASELTAVGDTLFFIISNGDGSESIGKSDGTVSGTVMVKNVGYLAYPEMIDVNGMLYFADGYRLWKSDGTLTGTIQIESDFDFSWCHFHPTCLLSHLTVVDDKLFFMASDGIEHGAELWVSDGTLTGTIQVMDIYSGSLSSYPSWLIAFDEQLLFTADSPLDGGEELWRSDGTQTGTYVVKDIFLGTEGSSPYGFTEFGDNIFFGAYEYTHGTELWKMSKNTAAMTMVKDIHPTDHSSPQNLVVMNDQLFFRALDASYYKGLWKTDGTYTNTVLLEEFVFDYNPSDFIVMSDTLFFAAADESHGGLWKSDGTATGTVLVKEFGTVGYYNFDNFHSRNGQLFFLSNDWGMHGLWRSDGTYTGTVQVRGFANNSHLSYLTIVNDDLFFAREQQLWRSDGTFTGTIMFQEFSSAPSNLVNVNDNLYFIAEAPEDRYGLWKSDGSPTGTIFLKGGFYRYLGPQYLTNVSGTLFFQAGTFSQGYELWKSDGTPDGTVIVKDICTLRNRFGHAGSSEPDHLIAVNGLLYFTADDCVHGTELWQSDGTISGTVMVSDLYPGAIGSDPTALSYISGTLYFSAKHVLMGKELWKLWTPSSQCYLPLIMR